MTTRDLLRAGLVALVLLSTVTAYDRVFETADWRPPALTAALASLVVATLVRAAGRGPVVAALASAIGFVALAPVLAGIVPSPTWPDAMLRSGVADILAEGLRELQVTPAPAPLLSGLVLLLVAGFWIVTHIAHELLVRWSRTGSALTVLTVLWAVPLVVPVDDEAWQLRSVPFLAAVAVLLLATSDARLPRARLATTGVAMAALAITAAATLPGILPGFATDAWYGLGRGDASPRGYQPIVDVSTRLQQPEEREVLRVLASQRTYLRLAGLETFDGFTWRLGPLGDGNYRPDPATLHPTDALLPPEEPAQATQSVFVDVEVRDLANIYVPVPYQPVQVLGPSRDDMVWSTDGGFLATWEVDGGELATGGPQVGVREGVSYRVRAERPAPTRERLLESSPDPATVERYTRLPREYPELAALAEDVYAAAGATSDVDRALALQEWFTGPGGSFTYDLQVPALRGEDALERFVLEDRVGYCEYFATGMAVMLRATGVPARVATGFLPGDQVTQPGGAETDDDGLTEYSVSTSDAHAWVEVLFPGFGWVTFEPTPRSDGAQIQPRADDLTPLETERERLAREGELGGDPDGSIAGAFEDDETGQVGAQADAGAGADEPRSRALTGPIGVTLGIVVVLFAGAMAVSAVRRRRVAPPTEPEARILAAQRRLHAAATRFGIPRRAQETSLELAERWNREGRIGPEGRRFAMLAQSAAFGGPVTHEHAEEAEDLAQRMITSIHDSVDPASRRAAIVRAPWERTRRRGRELLDTRIRTGSGTGR